MPTDTASPGATNLPPLEKYVATKVGSQGGYKGYNVAPGSDTYITSQLARIDALGSGTTPPPGTGTGPGTGGTPGTGTDTGTAPGAGTGTNLDDAYSKAMENYLSALTASGEADTTSEKAGIAARRQYQSILDAPGGTVSGAQQSAAYFNRRATSNLADLGVAQDAATRATQVANERLKYEQDRIKGPGDFNLSPGQTHYAYDPATGSYKPTASVPANEPAGPTSVQEYEYAKKQGYTGTYEQYQNEDANRKARAAAGPTTVAEKQAAVFSKIDSLLQPGKLSDVANHVPILAPDGYLTFDGFKTLLGAAREEGISRKQFLDEYKGYLQPGLAGDFAGYNLTGAEVKAIAPY